MSYPIRSLRSEGVYHVMNMAAAGQPMFQRDAHRRTFLHLLAKSVHRHDIEVHAYCLMGTHFHLLLRTLKPNLDAGIRYATSQYVRYYNADVGRNGPLFRSRYKSVDVLSDEQFVWTSRYIHRNPVDLGVQDLAKYPWSSMSSYISGRFDGITTIDFTLELAGGRERYASLVNESAVLRR